MMRSIAVAITLLVSSLGCDNVEHARSEGQRFVDSNFPIGIGLKNAMRVLTEHQMLDQVFPPAECDGFVFEPQLRCQGGSGIVATLRSNINPWNPFYSPSLRVFLAFDKTENLRGKTLYIEGGDR